MVREQVVAGRSTLARQAARATASDAAAELIWNGIDAEATKVSLRVAMRESMPEFLTVEDNGHGMSLERAREVFRPYGDSWKAERQRSENGIRPVRGRRGRGRFAVYGIAREARWSSIPISGDGVTVRGWLDDIEFFDFQPNARQADDRPGTTVRLTLTDTQKAAKVADADFRSIRTRNLAGFLLESTDVTVTLNGADLDPRSLIDRDEMLEVAWDPDEGEAIERPTLRVVEWKHEVHGGELFMLDDLGAVVSMRPMKGLAPTLSWSAYLKWEGFGREGVTEGDLLAPDFIWNGLVQAAEAAMVAYLTRRSDEVAHEVVESWKDRAVYPYADEPSSPREAAERQVFDVVAVTARRGLPQEDTQLRMSLRLLKEAFQHEPGRLPEILEGLLSLRREEVEALADLLTKTKFAGVITASRAVTDRLEFVQAFRELLFSDEHRDRFLERGQLHPLVAENCWIFGEEWHYSQGEIALSTLLRQHLAELRPGAKADPAGDSRRIDLLLSRVIPEHSEEVDLRRLVVELKRANRRIGEEEIRQIKAYARSITSSREAADERSWWEFWLVGTDIQSDVEGERRQAGREFGCIDAPAGRSSRIWLYTWTELLDKATRKLEFYRERLGYSPAAEEALAAVAARYPEFMPDTLSTEEADEQASA